MLSSILIIGIGTEGRGDDEAGLRVARILRSMNLPSEVSIVEMSGDGAALMERWKDSPWVILVDSVKTDVPPGTIFRIDAHHQIMPADVCATTSHAFGLAQALAIGLALDELPPSIIVYGIQGERFEIGSEPSVEVTRAIRECVDSVRAEVHRILNVEPEAEIVID